MMPPITAASYDDDTRTSKPIRLDVAQAHHSADEVWRSGKALSSDAAAWKKCGESIDVLTG